MTLVETHELEAAHGLIFIYIYNKHCYYLQAQWLSSPSAQYYDHFHGPARQIDKIISLTGGRLSFGLEGRISPKHQSYETHHCKK